EVRSLALEAAAERGIARRATGDVAEPRLEAALGHGDVAPADHAAAPEQGKCVVAEAALRRRRVCLEAIGPAPEPLEAAPVPDDRVEGREEAHLVAGRLVRVRRRLVRGPVPVES